MKISSLSALIAAIGLTTFGAGLYSFSEAAAPKVTYKSVKSLLDTKCVRCHNDKRAAEGVDLSSYAAIKKGRPGKPTVAPGKPAASYLITYVDGTKSPRMPLRAPALTAKEIQLLKTWVKSGAKG